MTQKPKSTSTEALDRGLVDRLREAIDRCGGPAAVSKLSDIPLSTISNYLSGTEPRFSRVAHLAKVCKFSLDWLATGEEAVDSASEIELLKPEILNSKAHFWALFVLLRSCQEFHEQMKLTPTLRDVLVWISKAYIQHRDLPDNRIEFKSPAGA